MKTRSHISFSAVSNYITITTQHSPFGRLSEGVELPFGVLNAASEAWCVSGRGIIPPAISLVFIFIAKISWHIAWVMLQEDHSLQIAPQDHIAIIQNMRCFYSNYITIDLIIAACLFCIRLYRLSFVWERILHSLDCNQCLKRHYDLGTKCWHCLGDEMEQMIRCSFFCSSVIPTCNCLRRIRTIYM